MGPEYVTLMGTEVVERAARNMQSAADTISSAISGLDFERQKLEQTLGEFLGRLEEVMKGPPLTEIPKRPVMVYDWKKREDGKDWDRVKRGRGDFCGFGSDTIEADNGFGTYSTAIVEMEKGKIINVPVDMIEFMDKRDW